MITAEEMAKLLGRSLTSTETTNYDLYINIATEHLEELLCVDLTESESAEDRTFSTRVGYRTAYVDFYRTLTSVTVDGEEVDAENYIKKQNDRFNGSWYNIIEFDSRQAGQNIVVNAEWGFGVTGTDPDEVSNMPKDLQMLLAQLFNQVSLDQKTDGQVKSKKIEDFAVTYKDSTTLQELMNSNSSVIDKYSQCNQGAIRHGRIYTLCNY